MDLLTSTDLSGEWCPIDQDDLSDGSSLELMAGDFPLMYHGDQIGLY